MGACEESLWTTRARVAMWSSPRRGRPRCVTDWTPGCDAGDCCVALLRGSAETWLSRLAESRGVTGRDVVAGGPTTPCEVGPSCPTAGVAVTPVVVVLPLDRVGRGGGSCRRVSWLWVTPRVLTAGVVSTSQTVTCGD